MDRCIIFIVGAISSVAAEAFWKGESHMHAALWGGAAMLLLRRIALRFPGGNRALLCMVGALLLIVLRLTFLLLKVIADRSAADARPLTMDLPSFSYGLYRFMLVAPAYAVIEYLEARFGI